ncbi:MAG: DUF2911 domain-containing protein, partial [Bacteroidota bacterium]
GKVWRTGANEATTFETDQDIRINGSLLKAGKYALFTIPGEKTWTFIFNRNHDQWGAFGYNEELDALRVDAQPEAHGFTEKLTFQITSKSTGKGAISLTWEKLAISLELQAE